MREDFMKLKESPLIGPDIKIYGFVYDVTVRTRVPGGCAVLTWPGRHAAESEPCTATALLIQSAFSSGALTL